MKKSILLPLFLMCCFIVNADDVIFTTAKQQIFCTITEISDAQVSYTRSDTPSITRHIATENVWKIVYGNGVIEEINPLTSSQPEHQAIQQQTVQQSILQPENVAVVQTYQGQPQAAQPVQQIPQQQVQQPVVTTTTKVEKPQPLRIVGKNEVYLGDQKLGASLTDIMRHVPGAYDELQSYQILKGTGIGLTIGGAIAVVPGVVFNVIAGPEYAAIFYGLGGACLLSGVICWASSGKHLRNAVDIYNARRGHISKLEFEPSMQGLGLTMRF